MTYVALTIAGSDSCGGAGIQADIKTMTAHGVYATSALTALTAQNTTGVTSIMNVTPEFLAAQLDAIFTDIAPQAVKIGMVSSAELICTIKERLQHYQAKNIVLDPVMAATSGAKLIDDTAIETLKTALQLARVITPNIPETEILIGHNITSSSDMQQAAQELANTYGCAVLVKGGHNLEDANDYLFDPSDAEAPHGTWFYGSRVDTQNTHGTGCTLSSAIASNLAKGFPLAAAIEQAKAFLSDALASGMNLGAGSGPLNHMVALNNKYTLDYEHFLKESGAQTEGSPAFADNLPKSLFKHKSRSLNHQNPYL